ncbi:MAG TPA: hypothetical protein VM557_13655 [Thermoanaerobaculia bacterium]|nr:hypothetical protein [Thermoanaerobaculia bacterium]
MKSLLLAGFCLAASALIAAEPSKAPKTAPASSEETASQEDSPLVKAAKDARKNREKSRLSGIVITDDVVKNSGGRVTIVHSASLIPELNEKDEPAGEILDRMANEKSSQAAARLAADARVTALEKEIAAIEKSLGPLEEEYYEEEDPENREDEIFDRYQTAKRSLDEKKAALTAAREEARRLKEASNVVAPKP